MSAAIINKSNLKIEKEFEQAITLDSISDITVSHIEKNNIQFLVVINRGKVTGRMLTMITQFKAIYTHITLIYVSNQLTMNDNRKLFKAGIDHFLYLHRNKKSLTTKLSQIFSSSRKVQSLPLLQIDDLIINPNNKEVRRGDKRIQLRRKEFDLLEFLMQNPGRTFNRSILLELVWKYRSDTLSNTVDSTISSLRRKIDRGYERKLIQTVFGKGYKLQ